MMAEEDFAQQQEAKGDGELRTLAELINTMNTACGHEIQASEPSFRFEQEIVQISPNDLHKLAPHAVGLIQTNAASDDCFVVMRLSDLATAVGQATYVLRASSEYSESPLALVERLGNLPAVDPDFNLDALRRRTQDEVNWLDLN